MAIRQRAVEVGSVHANQRREANTAMADWRITIVAERRVVFRAIICHLVRQQPSVCPIEQVSRTIAARAVASFVDKSGK